MPLFSEEERDIKDFIKVFGFHPDKLAQRRYKKEALLRLGVLAKCAAREADMYQKVESEMLKVFYDEAYSSYEYAFELIEVFDPDLAEEIPHWTELPKFISRWLNGRSAPTTRRRSSPQNQRPRKQLLLAASAKA